MVKHALATCQGILCIACDNMSAMEYGARLAHAMELAGKNQTQLGKALGISGQSVGQAINGKTKSNTAENCARAAKYLGVDWYWLATGEGIPRPPTPALMDERMALSVDAVRIAQDFDKLPDSRKTLFRTLLMTVETAVSNERVEQHYSLPPTATDKPKGRMQ